MIKYLSIILVIMFFLASNLVGEKYPAELLNAGSRFMTLGRLEPFAQADDLNRGLLDSEEKQSDRKSISKAILLSLAIPGLGEFYVGRHSRAVGFFAAEVSIWSTFAFLKYKQHWLKDDYINWAREYAGIDPDAKSDQFYDMLGFYDSRDEYNKVSRVYSRNNPFFPETPTWDWQWESRELRMKYRDIKNSSKAQGRNANFVLGLALANRVISAVDAWWTAKNYNRYLSPLFGGFKLKFAPTLSDLLQGDWAPGIQLRYKYSF